ncbi:GrpB family protein [Planosporangium sp. 12N6]|uniref:GrpB family protein n=1 Tax=Planosporangium spinosum TaxID=3402278 RepID=UPI003CF687BA
MTSPAEWPAWATEEISLAEPAADWPARGAEEVERLARSLHGLLVAGPEHVGSTAVPGLAAKPILDLMAGVASLDDAGPVEPLLAPEGWHPVPPDLDGRPWRRFFVKVAHGHRVAHLHLMEPTNRRWHDQLVFRDALRADPALRAEYAALKRALTERFRHDREAYTEAKAAFVTGVLAARPA